MGSPLSEAEIAAWFARNEEFISSRPPRVAAVMRRYPAAICYRSTQNPKFHYTLYSVSEPKGTGDDDNLPITVTLVHGRDSTLPGTATFGQDPDQLIRCNCGNWEGPTEDQRDDRTRHVERHWESQGKCAGCLLDKDYPGRFRHGRFCSKKRGGPL